MNPTIILQIGTMVALAIIGYFIRRLDSKLDKHDEVIFQLNGHVQRLVGRQEVWDGSNRRTNPR